VKLLIWKSIYFRLVNWYQTWQTWTSPPAKNAWIWRSQRRSTRPTLTTWPTWPPWMTWSTWTTNWISCLFYFGSMAVDSQVGRICTTTWPGWATPATPSSWPSITGISIHILFIFILFRYLFYVKVNLVLIWTFN